jgi:hypothetical protein
MVPHKRLTLEEIDRALDNPNLMTQEDPLVDMGVVANKNVLYLRLWTLSCVALVLTREHIKKQPDHNRLITIYFTNGVKYLIKTILAFGVEIETIDNLTSEAEQRVVQVFFEKIIVAINENL